MWDFPSHQVVSWDPLSKWTFFVLHPRCHMCFCLHQRTRYTHYLSAVVAGNDACEVDEDFHCRVPRPERKTHQKILCQKVLSILRYRLFDFVQAKCYCCHHSFLCLFCSTVSSLHLQSWLLRACRQRRKCPRHTRSLLRRSEID